MMRLPLIALAGCLLALPAGAQTQTVDAFNFARAESDLYFASVVGRNGGLNRLVHDREPTPIDEQTVVRMNRDTFYSSSVHDLAAGPVRVSLPEREDGRFQSLQVVSQDHYTPFVIYDGTQELTEQNVGTRYVMLVFRTFVDPSDPNDIAAAQAAQDAITVEQAADGAFEIPDWDEATQEAARSAIATLQALGGSDDKVRMGTAEEVDPIAHLMATATGWGLNPKYAAMYFTGYPSPNDASTVQKMTLRDVPADGFWSVSVYNAEGYFEENTLGAYSLNNVTAKADAEGQVTIQFGGCQEETPNCLPIVDGWNYSLRLYRPREEVLNGSWQPPALVTP